MSSFFMMKNLSILPILFLVWACDSDKGPGTYQSSVSAVDAEEYLSDADLKIGRVVGKKVDFKDLRIFDLVIAKREANRPPLVEFSVSGGAEYVEMEVCSLEVNLCQTSKVIFDDRAIVPLAAGRHNIKMKACVTKNFSKSGKGGCGEASYTKFDYPRTLFNKVRSLYEKKAEIENALNEFAAEGRLHMKESLKELDQCEKDAKKREKAGFYKFAITGALALGDLLLDKAIIKGTKPEKFQKKIIGVTDDGTPISNMNSRPPVVSFAHGTNGLGAAGSSIRKMNEKLGDKSFFKEQSAPALATIGGAVFDLFKAKDLVSVPCLAGEKYKNKMTEIESLMANLHEELFFLDEDIAVAIEELEL